MSEATREGRAGGRCGGSFRCSSDYCAVAALGIMSTCSPSSPVWCSSSPSCGRCTCRRCCSAPLQSVARAAARPAHDVRRHGRLAAGRRVIAVAVVEPVNSIIAGSCTPALISRRPLRQKRSRWCLAPSSSTSIVSAACCTWTRSALAPQADIDRTYGHVLGTEERIVLAIGTRAGRGGPRPAAGPPVGRHEHLAKPHYLGAGPSDRLSNGGEIATFSPSSASSPLSCSASAPSARSIASSAVRRSSTGRSRPMCCSQNAMCALGAETAINQHTETLVVPLVLAMFAVVGSISIARFMAKQDAS